MPYFVLTTAPQLEFRARDALVERGYTVVMPHEEHEIVRRYSPRLKDMRPPTIRKTPIMRRYLFVQAPNSGAVGEIVYRMSLAPRRLITGYLGSYGNPMAVPDEHVSAIQAMSGRRITQGTPIKPLQVGDVARIINGPASGQTATVRSTRNGKVKMLLTWLGSQREVEVTASSLEAV
jgi:transcription antitermination factor NusG